MKFILLITALIFSISFSLQAQVAPDLQNTNSILKFQSPDTVNMKPKLRFTAGGRIKLQGIYDFNGLQDDENFDIFQIPIGANNTHDPRFFFGAEQSRFKFDARMNTQQFKEIRAYMEGDFAGSGNVLRLRHAYVKVSKFLFGQYWSAFTNEDAFPSIVDNDGPATSIFARNPQIRYTTMVGAQTEIAVSAEYTNQLYEAIPELDSLVATTHQTAPDLVARVKQRGHWGQVQLALLGRNIKYLSGDKGKSKLGWGASLSAILNTGPKANFMIQGVYGKGIAKYLNGFSFASIDARPNGQGELITYPVLGGFAAYQFFYGRAKNFTSTLVYGYAGVENPFNPDIHHKLLQGNYFSANVGWILIPQLQIVLEGLYGNKTDMSGNKGDATRIQFMTMYDF
jgi:hypothetical protein